MPHAVTDHLAAAKLYFLAIEREVLFHLDEQLGIGQPHLVAGRWAIHVGVERAGNSGSHYLLLVKGKVQPLGQAWSNLNASDCL